MAASSCDGGEVFECALWCVFYALSEGVDGVFEVVVKLFLFRSMSCMVCSFGGVVGDADDVDEEHAQGQWVAVVEDSGCCHGLFE